MKMRGMMIASALFALVVAANADADDKAKAKVTGKVQPVMVNASEVKWGEAPPDLPKGLKLGVLFGDPSKKGPFTVRLKAPDGYKIPPHWHSQDEQLTVLAGTLVLHMGDTMESDAHELTAGAFHFLPGKMHHAAEMRGETIVQINGTGPFDIHYLKAEDNPNPKSARK